MVKKTKSKARLDKFYNLAKQQGYRSRAAFKLIQLNRKYNFLNTCNVLVDLCAAPGGWLQVAASVMPTGSTIIGLDLVSIKGIPGCRTFQQDITSPGAIQLLQRELKTQKADVFLHDGAPNVGASWIKDAYNQNELVLISLKLAAQFLKKGGMFITKVFRSADYNSLMWVFNKFFEKVEATKPVASRFVSAEIFVVCHNYSAPTYIDEKLFDAKHVFKDSEVDMAAQQVQKEITSVAKLLEKRRHRTGYSDDAPLTVYKTLPFEEFLTIDNPFPVFLEYNKISMTKEQLQKYTSLAKPPPDLEELLSDIQVLGKREILQLLKWKSKIKHQVWKQKKQNGEIVEEDAEAEEAEDLEEVDEEQEEQEEYIEDDQDLEFEEDEQPQEEEEKQEDSEVYEDLVEMQKEILNRQTEDDKHKELQQLRKQREKKVKAEKKLERGVGLGIDSDEELFSVNKHSKVLKKANYVELGEEKIEKPKKKEMKFQDHMELEKNLELIYEDRQARKQAMVEKEQQKRQEKELKRKGIQEEVDSDDYAAVPQTKTVPIQQVREIKNTLNHRFFDRDTFATIKDQLTKETEVQFDNPLVSLKSKENRKKQLKKPDDKPVGDDEDERVTHRQARNLQSQVQDDLFDLDYYIDEKEARSKKKIKLDGPISQEPFPDEEEKIKMYDLGAPQSEMKKRRERLRKEREKLEAQKQKDKLEADPNKGEFEVVPAKTFDDYDIDGLAATRALAKKLFRKKTRETIIENSFNRHTMFDDGDLPKWFKDDEDKHQYKIEPITKDEFQAEKQKLLAINAKVPKKVMEYKIRKWKKTQKKMRKAAQKASVIFEQDGVDDRIKLKQVQKIYKKEKAMLTKEKDKKYIVSRRGITGKGANKKDRHTRMVDPRLKKDKRAAKAQKIRKTIKKKRHVKRHKGRKQKS